MSERTFIRRFKEATGLAPGAWLVRERVGRARELLETTPAAIDAIAESCGFGTAAALRHQFHRHVGVPPTIYRARFATRS
jgi:AraC family transcriptional activator FtrA